MDHANSNDRKARMAILMWDEMDFKIKCVTRDKKGHFIMKNE